MIEALKPNRKKVIISLIVILIWYVVLFYINLVASQNLRVCPLLRDTGTFPLLFPSRCPQGIPSFEFLVQIFIILFLGLLVYAVLSYFEYRKKRKESQ